MILNHFCEKCVLFLLAMIKGENIKWAYKSYTVLALFSFSDPFSSRDDFQYPNSLSFKKCWVLLEEKDSDVFSVVSITLYKLSKSYQFLSIQSISRCHQLISTENRLEEK